jgi:hypothetical protein
MKNTNLNTEKYYISFNHGIISCNADACSDCEHSQEMQEITRTEAENYSQIHSELTGLYEFALNSTASNKGLR